MSGAVSRGTDYYGAPEARSAEWYSYGVDYWSFAICRFVFMTGILPYAVDPKTEDYLQPLVLDLNRSVLIDAEERDFFSRAHFFLIIIWRLTHL
ncbi:hypothetical protein DFH07DRAFT_850368 [Mycena maculata]|uniref:Protein kinase domain-containing protein n=1 Tax=Mycena maculata TaxID=230809 RepID=A0AAD7HVP3_9AGAR|nr:hypothetical protein DFH07DRAFT_850368 [Mycena maculata]